MQEISYRNRRGLLDQTAAAGRGGDTELAHLTPGEIVVPRGVQTPELRQRLLAALLSAGHDPERYVVGGPGDSRNPRTGLLEYFEGSTAADSHGSNSDGYSGADHGGAGHGAGGSSGDGYVGRDEGDRARAAAEAAAPGQGPFADATYDTHGYGPATLAGGRMMGVPGAWVGRQIDKAVANPFSTLANLAFSAVPGLGFVNTAMGLANMPTVGSVGTGLARAASGYGTGPSMGAPTGAAAGQNFAQAAPAPGSPTWGSPDDSRGGFFGDNGPSGSPESPLSKALAGTPQPAQVAQDAVNRAFLYQPAAQNSWDGNRFRIPSIGPLQSSFAPNGREYVTPWGYRG